MVATDVTAAILAPLSSFPVPIQKLVDKAARLELVQRLNCRAEHFVGKAIEGVLVEVIFFSDLFGDVVDMLYKCGVALGKRFRCHITQP